MHENDIKSTAENINLQLLDTNIKLSDLVNILLTRNQEYQDYINMLEKKIPEAKFSDSILANVLDILDDSIEIYNESLILVYQNSTSINDIHKSIGTKFDKIYSEWLDKISIHDIIQNQIPISRTLFFQKRQYIVKLIPEQRKLIVLRKQIQEGSIDSLLTKDKKRILHIDDDVNILNIVKLILRGKNYHIISEMEGAKALNLAIENEPDLIILDIMMPQLNGYEIIKQLKANRKTQHIPVIILTVKNEIQKSMELGAATHLTKPINIEMLQDTIYQILGYVNTSLPDTNRINVQYND